MILDISIFQIILMNKKKSTSFTYLEKIFFLFKIFKLLKVPWILQIVLRAKSMISFNKIEFLRKYKVQDIYVILKIFLSVLIIFHYCDIKHDLPIKWNQHTKFRCSMIKIKRKNEAKKF